MFVHAPADTDRLMTLGKLVETLRITVWGIRTGEIAAQPSTDGRAWSVSFLEALAPLTSADDAVLVRVARVNERFDALFILGEWKLFE